MPMSLLWRVENSQLINLSASLSKISNNLPATGRCKSSTIRGRRTNSQGAPSASRCPDIKDASAAAVLCLTQVDGCPELIRGQG